MKHAIIVAHPNAESFTLSLAAAYGAAVIKAGHQPILRDLYRMNFDPCLRTGEIPGAPGFAPAPDAKTERGLIADAGVFVFVYPFWFNAPPAMLTGYIDRVLGPGFGFAPGAWGSQPLLGGRGLINITASGAPTEWVEKSGAMAAHQKIFAEHVAEVCGMELLEHLHFGGIASEISGEAVAQSLEKVASLVARRFAQAH